jgi:hypothetical protein
MAGISILSIYIEDRAKTQASSINIAATLQGLLYLFYPPNMALENCHLESTNTVHTPTYRHRPYLAYLEFVAIMPAS